MRYPKTWLSLAAAAAFGAGLSLTTGLARAEDPSPAEGGMPPPLKAIKHPFIDCMLGEWTHDVSAAWGPGRGKSSMRMAAGGTMVVQDYETGAGDGKSPDFWGHGVIRVSEDGKTATTWWFDTHMSEPTVFSGPLTEKGYEGTATTPRGPMRVTWEKTDAGVTMKLYGGGTPDEPMMTDVYKPAPK